MPLSQLQVVSQIYINGLKHLDAVSLPQLLESTVTVSACLLFHVRVGTFLKWLNWCNSSLLLKLVLQLCFCCAACGVWLSTSVRQLLSNYWKVQQKSKWFGAELLTVWERAHGIRKEKHRRLLTRRIMLLLDNSKLFKLGMKFHWAAECIASFNKLE